MSKIVFIHGRVRICIPHSSLVVCPIKPHWTSLASQRTCACYSISFLLILSSCSEIRSDFRSKRPPTNVPIGGRASDLQPCPIVSRFSLFCRPMTAAYYDAKYPIRIRIVVEIYGSEVNDPDELFNLPDSANEPQQRPLL